MDVRRLGGAEVLGGAARARVKPGTVLGHEPRARAAGLARPGSASTDIACVGGCSPTTPAGCAAGSWPTPHGATPHAPVTIGTVIDGHPDAVGAAHAEPELANGLGEMRDEIAPGGSSASGSGASSDQKHDLLPTLLPSWTGTNCGSSAPLIGSRRSFIAGRSSKPFPLQDHRLGSTSMASRRRRSRCRRWWNRGDGGPS